MTAADFKGASRLVRFSLMAGLSLIALILSATASFSADHASQGQGEYLIVANCKIPVHYGPRREQQREAGQEGT